MSCIFYNLPSFIKSLFFTNIAYGMKFTIHIDFGISADVFPILYFVDSRSELKITDDAEINVAIINSENDLLDFIMKSKGKHIVDESERSEIIRFFKK